MFGSYTSKRTDFTQVKDINHNFYQKDRNEPMEMLDIPPEINMSPHITIFVKNNMEEKLSPGPGYYDTEKNESFKRPQSSLKQSRQLAPKKQLDEREYTFNHNTFKKMSVATEVHSFNTSDRWPNCELSEFQEEKQKKLEQERINSIRQRKRSKFCQ